jgi:transcriptional regulator with XRE-family HTH domain
MFCFLYFSAMNITLYEDTRTKILTFLTSRGISQARLGIELGIQRSTMSNILKCRERLTQEKLDIINQFLGTDFVLENSLPHEQLQLDRESIKEKPLFKD